MFNDQANSFDPAQTPRHPGDPASSPAPGIPGDDAPALASLQPLGLTPPWITTHRQARVDAVFLRVARAAALPPAENAAPDPRLHPADEAALDHFFDADADGTAAAATAAAAQPTGRAWVHAGRAEVHHKLHRLLAATPMSETSSTGAGRTPLTDGVLARIERAEAEADAAGRFRLPGSDPDARRGAWSMPGVRVTDVLTAAAALLLTASVAWPVLERTRQSSMQAACLSSLGVSARAFASYTDDHDSTLPLATAGFSGHWNRVGQPGASNSANLYTLVVGGYEPLEALACPENAEAPRDPALTAGRDWRTPEQVSYSYQVPTPHNVRVSALRGDEPLLADRSPVWMAAAQGEPIELMANSPLHQGRGQNVLLTDGSAGWWSQAIAADGDVLWLPDQVQVRISGTIRFGPEGLSATIRRSLTGMERPSGPGDALLGP